ncbi:MAG TPA: ATP-binding protein, partial [Longimicrobiales bacterium]
TEADKVFEEVHRVEQSRGNVRFRLAICRRIARLLGGDLTLDTVMGKGSSFTLWLPAPTNSRVVAE